MPARKEDKLSNVSAKERVLFDIAIEKEWRSWVHFDAVEVMSEKMVKEFLAAGGKPVGTRGVFLHGQA